MSNEVKEIESSFNLILSEVFKLGKKLDEMKVLRESSKTVTEAELEETLGFPPIMADDTELRVASHIAGVKQNMSYPNEAVENFESEVKPMLHIKYAETTPESYVGSTSPSALDFEISMSENNDGSDGLLEATLAAYRNSRFNILFSEDIDVDEYVDKIEWYISENTERHDRPKTDDVGDYVLSLFNNADPDSIEVTKEESSDLSELYSTSFTIGNLNNRKVHVLYRFIEHYSGNVGHLWFYDEYNFRKAYDSAEYDVVMLLYVMPSGEIILPRQEVEYNPDLINIERNPDVSFTRISDKITVKSTFDYVDGKYSGINYTTDVCKSFDESVNILPKVEQKDMGYYSVPGISSSLLRKFDGTLESVMEFVTREESLVRSRPMTLGRFGEDFICGVSTRENYFEIPDGYKISDNEIAALRYIVGKVNSGVSLKVAHEDFMRLGILSRFSFDKLQRMIEKEHVGIVSMLTKNPNLDFIRHEDSFKLKQTVLNHAASIKPIKYAKVATQQNPFFTSYEGYTIKGLPDLLWLSNDGLRFKVCDIKITLLQHLDARTIVRDKDYFFQLAFYCLLAQDHVDFNAVELSNLVVNLPKGTIDEVKMKGYELNIEISRIKMKLNALVRILNETPSIKQKFI